jgi:hypothetical protein
MLTLDFKSQYLDKYVILKRNLDIVIKSFGVTKFYVKPIEAGKNIEILINEWYTYFEVYDGVKFLEQYLASEPNLIDLDEDFNMGMIPGLLNEAIRESSCKSAIKFNDRLSQEQA